jgi:hypothetical protein
LYPLESVQIWEAICARLNWAYKPDAWVTDLTDWAKF